MIQYSNNEYKGWSQDPREDPPNDFNRSGDLLRCGVGADDPLTVAILKNRPICGGGKRRHLEGHIVGQQFLKGDGGVAVDVGACVEGVGLDSEFFMRYLSRWTLHSP